MLNQNVEVIKWEKSRPKITWKKVVSKDLQSLRIYADLARNKTNNKLEAKDSCRQH